MEAISSPKPATYLANDKVALVIKSWGNEMWKIRSQLFYFIDGDLCSVTDLDGQYLCYAGTLHTEAGKPYPYPNLNPLDQLLAALFLAFLC